MPAVLHISAGRQKPPPRPSTQSGRGHKRQRPSEKGNAFFRRPLPLG
ncbi:hypothetical protein [Kingella potus]|nr:hypothetical protein [Kingella potus]UOP01182.1 hypothetical protein LVJ84_02410 [Kingella potus]